MKIPSLLAQYLYNNHRLDLPGIGSFTLDMSSLQSLQNSKLRTVVLEGVSFENKFSLQESPELISFIAEKTGKMKALAAADLDSHLQLAQQFLNIGKPFTFEGIGILSKVKPGELEFISITVSTEKIKGHHFNETISSETKEVPSSRYESFLSGPKTKIEWKKPVIGLLVLCSVGLTIGGGYIISQKNKIKPVNTVAQKIVSEKIAIDTLPKSDSIASIPTAKPVNNNYKYVLEIAKSKRAFKRYNQLKTIRWEVQLETSDSIQYKLYMLLPSLADTARTLDSLTVMTGKKVYIEYQN